MTLAMGKQRDGFKGPAVEVGVEVEKAPGPRTYLESVTSRVCKLGDDAPQ